MTELTVRLAGPDDVSALAALIRQQDAHYCEGDPGADRAERAVRRWIAADGALGRFAIAYAGGVAAGFAAFAIVHPGEDLSGLVFMKDLFVTETDRGRGTGKAIMRFLSAFCVENGICRIDFPTDLTHAEAQTFYRWLGAKRLKQAGYHRLTGDALLALAIDKA